MLLRPSPSLPVIFAPSRSVPSSLSSARLGSNAGSSWVASARTIHLSDSQRYIKRLRVDLAYTTFWGAGEWNMLNDRDNINLSIRYAF